jgi:hypothetical protein
MAIEIFALCLAVPAVLVLAALSYLRPVLRDTLMELGVSEQGVEFWLRAATALTLIGSVGIVQLFGNVGSQEWGDLLRRILVWSLFGSFVSVAVITRLVWRSRPAQCASRSDEAGEESCAS